MTWKAQLKVTGKTFTKPKIKLEPEVDDKCNKELMEYARKLKKAEFVIKGEIGPSKLLDYATVRLNNTSERHHYRYKPVPEEIACKALEMLKAGTDQSFKIDNYNIDLERYTDNTWHTFVLYIIENYTNKIVITKSFSFGPADKTLRHLDIDWR